MDKINAAVVNIMEDYKRAIRNIEDAEQLVVDAVTRYQDYILETTADEIDHDDAEEELKSLWTQQHFKKGKFA